MTLQTASQLAFTDATSSSDFDNEFLAMTILSVILPSNVPQNLRHDCFAPPVACKCQALKQISNVSDDKKNGE